MGKASLAYYAQPGRMTDAGPYAALFDALPRDIPSLVKALQGVMVHIFLGAELRPRAHG